MYGCSPLSREPRITMRGTPVLVLLMLMYYVVMAPLDATGIVGAIVTCLAPKRGQRKCWRRYATQTNKDSILR